MAKQPKSIKNKIIKTIVLVTFVITFLASIGLGLFLRQQARQNQSANLLSSSKNLADKILLFIEENELLAKGFAGNESLINWTKDNNGDASEITRWLNGINFEQRYSAIYVLDKTGLAVASTDSEFIGKSYLFRKYAQESLAGKSGFDMAIGVTSRQPGYYFSAPIKTSEGEIVGVLVLKLIPSYLHSILLRDTERLNDKIMLADKNGVIIYSNIKGRIYNSFGPMSTGTRERIESNRTYPGIEIKTLQYNQAQTIIENKITESKLLTFFDAEDGVDEAMIITPINPYDLSVIIEAEVNNYITLVTILTNFGTLLFLAVALTLIVLLIINRFLQPITKLKIMANNISQGIFNQKNLIKSEDELGDLGKAIENMSDKLKNYYSDLEKGITKKTKELQDKTESIESAKKAIMNILEDVEVEKNKNFELAKDLEKFKLALDNASDSIIITDKNGIILYANGGVKKITGYTPKEIFKTKAGKLWGKIMGEDYYINLWETIKTNKEIFTNTIKNKRKNGEDYEANIAISPVLNNDQEVEFFVCIERDITREKEIDKAKTEFVSLAAHQLRTPLSSINWYTEMLLAGDVGKLNKQQSDFVDEIHQGNERMIELVNSLLNVSRLELGTFMIEPKPTNISDICESVLNELLPSITVKKMKIIKKYDKDIPLIDVDQSLTRIVFQNLLSNAVKYTPEKGKIEISLIKDKKNINIIISDTGYGIPENQKDKIFDKLFRADNIKIKDTEGTGLGLYMVKSIMDSSGGSINFKSIENKGTEFIATIPLSGMKKKIGSKTLN